MTDLTDKFRFMAIATFVAFRALKNGETPVACIFVHEPTGRILSFGCNDTNRSLNGTRHAEFVAVDKILEENELKNKPQEVIQEFFENVALYVTVEPCVMCALAIKQLGIGKVYFGAANDRFGGNGTIIKIQGDDSYPSYGGIMRVEAIQLLRVFYIQENDTAPIPKIKKNKDIEGKEFPPNLHFEKYVTKSQFSKAFGDDRCSSFYPGPNALQEITAKQSTGYDFLNLLISLDIEALPHFSDLYPRGDTDIACDIQELNDLLPSIADDGTVIFRSNSPDSRKRKLEANEAPNETENKKKMDD